MNAPNHEPKPRKPSNFDLTVDQSVSMLVHMLATEQTDIALAAKILMDRTAEAAPSPEQAEEIETLKRRAASFREGLRRLNAIAQRKSKPAQL